jgi:hypothetical protein
VIRFRVQFAPGATVYTYVAWHGANGGWYVTNSEKHYSWKSLVELMRKDVTTKQRGGKIQYYLYSTGDADHKSGWVNP